MKTSGVTVSQLLRLKRIEILLILCVSIVVVAVFHLPSLSLPEFEKGCKAATYLQQGIVVYDIAVPLHNRFDEVPTALPLYALFTHLDSKTASKTFFVLWVVLLTYSLYRVVKIIYRYYRNPNDVKRWGVTALAIGVVAPLVYSQLISGSLSVITLFGFVVVIDLLIHRWKIASGAALGLFFLITPQSLVLIIPLLICHRWRSLIPFLAVAVSGWSLIIPFSGGTIAAGSLVLDWYAMVSENGLFSGSSYSIASLLYTFNHFSIGLVAVLFIVALAVIINPLWFRFSEPAEYTHLLVAIFIVVFALLPLGVSSGMDSYMAAIPVVLCGVIICRDRGILKYLQLIAAGVFAYASAYENHTLAFWSVVLTLTCVLLMLTSERKGHNANN